MIDVEITNAAEDSINATRYCEIALYGNSSITQEYVKKLIEYET